LPRRVTLLAAQVEAALAARDLDEAALAAEALERIAGETRTPAHEATAADAIGAVALAAAEGPAALGSFRRACAIWQDLKLPYETARTRVRLAQALRLAGAEEDAGLELRAALATFERLGARPDVAATARLLGGPAKLPARLTAREAEVLRHVAAGKTNRDIAVELVISEHTVARHLQNIFAKLGVTSRSAATAFAFEHGLA
jgi:DNA-binding CsgD family transcriptional regulator